MVTPEDDVPPNIGIFHSGACGVCGGPQSYRSPQKWSRSYFSCEGTTLRRLNHSKFVSSVCVYILPFILTVQRIPPSSSSLPPPPHSLIVLFMPCLSHHYPGSLQSQLYPNHDADVDPCASGCSCIVRVCSPVCRMGLGRRSGRAWVLRLPVSMDYLTRSPCFRISGYSL